MKSQRPRKVMSILKGLLTNEILEFAAASHPQPAAAAASYRKWEPARVFRHTLPHAPRAKMT